VALGASLWGTDTVLRRPLTASLASSQIVLFEHLILALVLPPAAWRSRAQWRILKPLEWAALLGISWGGSALATVLFTEAIRIGSPTSAVLLQKTQPLFAALLAWALLREALGLRFWLSLLAALCGAYLVSVGSLPPRDSAAQAGLSAALLALAAAARWRAPAALLDTRQAASLLLLALVPGLAGTILYYRGLVHTRASRAAVAELSFPAVATLLNWAFLGTPVSAVQLAGFVLLWGVILNLERRHHAESGD